MNHHLSWLELSPQMPTPAILLQDKNFLLSSVHCDNPAVLVDTKWSNCPYTSSDALKKVSEKAGKIPSIGNNHRKDLSCNLAGQKRVHLWNTSKCSLPFSPGKQDTTTQQCHFLLAKVLIRKSWVYCHMSYTIEHRIHQNLFANAAHWTEHISFNVTKLTILT